MRAELTDDYWYIIYNTIKGDEKLVEHFHFCSPAGFVECANHTADSIYHRTIGDVSFYAFFQEGLELPQVFDDNNQRVITFGHKNKKTSSNNPPKLEGSLIGYACFDMGGDRLFSFGMRIESRKSGMFPVFISELLKFGNKDATICVTENNGREIEALSKAGYKRLNHDRSNCELTMGALVTA